ncbi:EamA family transporter [Candidatus Gottesmanbacteria bacterium]|nr:EamA family transporter [Candidatus Gottesmanbacteria bacterium]
MREIPSISYAFIRFLIASLIVIPILHSKSHLKIKTLKDIIPISLFASVNIIFFVLGVKLTTANVSQLLYTATPLLTAIILFMVFKETLSKQKIIGLIIGLLGVALIIILPIIQNTNPFSGDLTGNLLVATAVISWSFYMAFSKKLLANYSPFTVTSVFIIITTIVLFPLFLYQFSLDSSWILKLSGQAITSVLYVALLGTIGAYFLNQYAIKHGGAVFASMAYYLNPLVTFLLSFILLGEKLTIAVLTGGLFALLGVYIVTKKR